MTATAISLLQPDQQPGAAHPLIGRAFSQQPQGEGWADAPSKSLPGSGVILCISVIAAADPVVLPDQALDTVTAGQVSLSAHISPVVRDALVMHFGTFPDRLQVRVFGEGRISLIIGGRELELDRARFLRLLPDVHTRLLDSSRNIFEISLAAEATSSVGATSAFTRLITGDGGSFAETRVTIQTAGGGAGTSSTTITIRK